MFGLFGQKQLISTKKIWSTKAHLQDLKNSLVKLTEIIFWFAIFNFSDIKRNKQIPYSASLLLQLQQ
jgi:hypothetical protein